jgi:putative ABC transport system permease protein
MTTTGFILRNALRNKRRLILTVLSVALSLFLFVTLRTALKLMTEPPTTDQAALRLAVRHKVSLANVLPEKYQYRIERIPGVKYCSKFTYFGGIYKDMSLSNFAQFGVDADRITKIFSEMEVDPHQEEAFVREKTACLVGTKLAERFGWKIGDRITLLGAMWPCDLELVLRAVYRGNGIDETMVFFHHDYMDEELGKLGLVGTFWIRADNAEVMPRVIERIDKMFANTDAETKTETERAFQLEFVSMIGNVKMFLGSILVVIVFTMLLVTASTMSMAIRERTREIAILKAVGFKGAQIFGLILAEAFGLAMTGGVIGCFGAKLLFTHLDIYKMSKGFIPIFPISADTLALGLVVAGLLGVVSSLTPTYSVLRLSVVNGLQELD